MIDSMVQYQYNQILQGMILALAANMMNLSHIGTWGGFGETPQLHRSHLLVLLLSISARRGMLNRPIFSL